MLLTITPNPALDKTVLLPGFTVGKTYRAEVLTLAGGKGLNVARAACVLGQPCLALVPLGGHGGRYLRHLARQEGLNCAGPEIAAELRTCLTIIDPQEPKRVTEVYEQGAALAAGDWERLVAMAASHFSQARFLAICGSFPAGMPRDGLVRLVTLAHAAELPVLLDTYGPQLVHALELRPALLKINQHEAGTLLDEAISTPRQASAAARALRQRGARAVVITLGERGAVGITTEGQAFGWSAPRVAALSPIGSGDCLLAGIATGLARGEALPEATRLGVAAGAANTLQIGAGRLRLQQVEELLQQVHPLPLT